MKPVLFVLMMTLAETTLALKPGVIAGKINEMVTELFVHDANVAYEQGDYKNAREKFLWLAKRENPSAQCGLGTIYEEGQGVPQDYKKAIEWYLQAAQQGYVLAQLKLARMYFFGKGVSQDNVMAYAWLYLAAAQGDEIGRKNRDRVAKLMAPEQIVVAQRLAQEWVYKYNTH